MIDTTSTRERRATLRSWIIVVVIVVLFLCWGLFIFFAVGNKGPAPWHYGVVQDIPGESPYGTERDRLSEPSPQHVAD